MSPPDVTTHDPVRRSVCLYEKVGPFESATAPLRRASFRTRKPTTDPVVPLLPNMASSDIPMQVAETIQTAHINREPSAAHDINPSTAADTRVPVQLDDKKVEQDYEDDIPTSVLRPRRRFSHLPPLPCVRSPPPRPPTPISRMGWYFLREHILTLETLQGPTVRAELFTQHTRRQVMVDDSIHHNKGSAGDAPAARSRVQPRLVRLGMLEQECSIQWE